MKASHVRRLRMRRKVADALDPISFALLGAIVALAAVGGVDLRGFGVPFTAHGLAPLGIALVAALVARRVADPVTPLRELPLFERLGEWSERPGLRARWVMPVAALAFVLLVGAAAWVRHATFRSNGYDLGLFENLLWNGTQGRWFLSDVLGRSFLGEHASLVLVPIGLVYALLPDTATLLALQTLALAAGVFPLVRVARVELKHDALAQVIGLAYLLYVPLRAVALFDFHPVAFAVPLLLEAFASLREGRTTRFAVACALALCVKETVAVPVATLGIYAALVLRRRGVGLAVAAVALAWLASYVGWIAPGIRGEAHLAASRYAALAEGRIGALITLDRVELMVLLLGPVALLPLVSPTHALLFLVPLAVHLLASDPHQRSIDYHYMSTVIPMVFAATVMGAQALISRDDLRVVLAYYPSKAQAQRYVAALLLVATAVFALWSPVTEIRTGWTPHRAAVSDVVAAVPAEGAVCAQGNLLPHLARRAGIGIFPWDPAPIVVLDRGGEPWPFARRRHLEEAIDRVARDPGCVTRFERDGALMLECDAAARERIAAIEIPPRGEG